MQLKIKIFIKTSNWTKKKLKKGLQDKKEQFPSKEESRKVAEEKEKGEEVAEQLGKKVEQNPEVEEGKQHNWLRKRRNTTLLLWFLVSVS